jgi:hypothetical protein
MATGVGPIARIGTEKEAPSRDGTPRLGVVTEGATQRIVHAHVETSVFDMTVTDTQSYADTGSALSAALSETMGDAPPCDVCGEITVRNGACYKCLNCGNSLGCS